MEYIAVGGLVYLGFMAAQQLGVIETFANYDAANIRGDTEPDGKENGKDKRSLRMPYPRTEGQLIVGLGADHQVKKSNVPISSARFLP